MRCYEMIFDFLKKNKVEKNDITLRTTTMQEKNEDIFLNVHPDIKDLIWVKDGPMRNYFPKKSNETTFNYGGIKITLNLCSMEEPSLVSNKMLISKVVDMQDIEALPYYPSYANLSPEQRYAYWKFLENPYDENYEMGYVFILYYGLERHLMEGDYKRAFDIILKLRDTYNNKSFQGYSACALILTCIIRKDSECALKFYNSLDKTYEYNFSDDLFLIFMFGLDIPINAGDIMRMAKTFGFKNNNYIKKYPELFLNKLKSIILEKYERIDIDLKEIIDETVWNRAPKKQINIFANMSLLDKAITLPVLAEVESVKLFFFDLLQEAHEKVKSELAQKRKNNELEVNKVVHESKPKKILIFDSMLEKQLINEYFNCEPLSMSAHFALISIQDFYYKYRDIDEKYVDLCEQYCKEDINNLEGYKEDFRRDALQYGLSTKFDVSIPAFKRLSIIYEKRKDYENAIGICNDAIKFYKNVGNTVLADEFRERKEKVKEKACKYIMKK